MNPLSSLEVESELSYAYIHAVAAHAGMECFFCHVKEIRGSK